MIAFDVLGRDSGIRGKRRYENKVIYHDGHMQWGHWHIPDT